MTPRQLRTWLPVATVALGALAMVGLLATRPRVEVEAPVQRAPRVRVLEVESQPVRLDVSTQGTVAPRTESDLVPEVSGPVTRMSPNLASGGFFEEGEILLEIDARDYAAAVERAKAALVRTRSQHSRADKDLSRRLGLKARGAASDAQIDDAENAERVAAAGVREVRSALEQAERDLERTRVRAPFTGRVREEHVGVGQFVTRGSPVATLYATDVVEVRLPIADRQLAFLDLPLARNDAADTRRAPVQLHANFAGAEHTWTGYVARTEGEIDARTRMVHVVARVDSPYEASSSRPPLAVGLFVRAEIEGREVAAAFVLPRSAVHGDDRVWVVDAESRLRDRPVQILRAERDRVVIASGLEEGERVLVSPLPAAADGMLVELQSAPQGVRS